MIPATSVEFIMKVGIDEYEGERVYFHAKKFYMLSFAPQLNINVKMLDGDIVKWFFIRAIDFDLKTSGYTVYDRRMVQRYSFGGPEGRIEWAKNKEKIYEEHGWQITRVKEY